LHKLKIFLVFKIIFPFTFYAQSNEPIITDRPDITESAITVPINSLQVETGFVLQHSNEFLNDANANLESFSIAGTLLRYGLTSSIELRAATEYLHQRFSLPSTNIKHEGINSLLLGSKIQLFRDEISFPDAALFLHLNLPVGNENFISDKIEPEVIIALSHPLNERFSISSNLGGNYTSKEQLYYLYTLSFGISLSDKFGTFLEIFGEAAPEIAASNNLDAGITYLIQSNFQIDTSAGINFNDPGYNWFLNAGAAFRFPE